MENKPENFISAKNFFDSFKFIFHRYNVQSLTAIDKFLNYINGYSHTTSIKKNNFIDIEILDEKLKLIWHAAAGTQTEVANFLIYYSEFKYTKPETDIHTLGRALCSHHLSLSYECIYRVWEKVTHVLYYLHYKDINKTIYYNGIVDILTQANKYEPHCISALKFHIKHWNKIAEIRNKYSHEESRLFKYEFKPSTILNSYGLPYSLNEETTDFRAECNTLIKRYHHLLKVNETLIEFLNKFPESTIVNPNKN